jgi:hypothetical protein
VESRIDDAERKMQELERRLAETTQLGFLVSGRLRGREYIRAAQVSTGRTGFISVQAPGLRGLSISTPDSLAYRLVLGQIGSC